VLLDEADGLPRRAWTRGPTTKHSRLRIPTFPRVQRRHPNPHLQSGRHIDEAFKARIQLTLYYKNLDTFQQKKIWRNFLTRIKELYENDIDYDDINRLVSEAQNL